MEASQHSLLAACFALHSINATLAIVPQRGAGLRMIIWLEWSRVTKKFFERKPGRTRFQWLKNVENDLRELKEGGK
jgi:hypothetical protein